MKFAKFLRIPFLQNTSGRLLLKLLHLLEIPLYLSLPLTSRIHSSSQFPLLIPQSIGPGLYGVLLYIVIIGVIVVLYIPPSVLLLVVVTVVGIAVVISPFVVVSTVDMVIDVATLVPPFVVASAVVIETNGVELLPPAVVLSAVVITVVVGV